MAVRICPGVQNKFGFVSGTMYLWSMERISRQYLGVTITASNYREILEKEGRDGINYHTKHLKAYLQGKPTFRHKFMRNEEGEILRNSWGHPIYNEYRVQQQIILPTSNEGDVEEAS